MLPQSIEKLELKTMMAKLRVESVGNRGESIGRKRDFQTGAERVRAGQPTATDEVVMKVRRWLATGRIVPGQRLTEADLSRELGVSKGPVREAMQRLSGDGLIDLAPYKGFLVHRMTRSEVEGVFDVLEAIEGLSARRGAENIAAGASKEGLLQSLAEFDHAHFEVSRIDLTGNEKRLNDVLIDLSGNKMIKMVAERIQLSVFPLQFHALQKQGVPERLLEMVRKFVLAILDGNAKAAEAGARAHTRALCDHILALSDEWFEPETDFGEKEHVA
jgi:DNA-binding GntR family transcriptional regulator